MASAAPPTSRRWRLEAVAVGGLCVLVWFVLGQALWFPLVDGDDLALLASASRAASPLAFFADDWGLGNHAYRPLHAVSLWATYALAGDAPLPAQAVNLTLHLAVCIGLWSVLRRVSEDDLVVWLVTAAFSVSPFTMSPATWVSDRPTLLVALCLVTTVSVLLTSRLLDGSGWTRQTTVTVLGCSAVALLSKESGLLVPCLAVFAAARAVEAAPSERRIVVTGSLALIGGYLVLRLLIFGASSAAYAESGALFGVVPYRSSADLSTGLRLVAAADTVVRNLLAIFLRVFNPDGSWLAPAQLARRLPVWASVVALVVLCWRWPLAPPQQIGLVVIVVNAVLHYALFRFRIQYLAEMGLTLFLAGATQCPSKARRAAVIAMAFVLMMTNARTTRAVVGGELQSHLAAQAAHQ